MKYLLFDTDLLGDDLVTLAAICFEPDVQLVSVSAYGRRIGALRRSGIALHFLEALGVSGIDIIPGADSPLFQDPLEGCRFCDKAIDSFVEQVEKREQKFHNRILENLHGAEYLAKKARDKPGMYSLLCTGPLTNIALAFLLDRQFPENIKEIVIMGGAWIVNGNSSPVAESNIYNDPEAAKIVFDHFKHITVVPLDVTTQVCTLPASVEKANPGILLKFIREIISSCCEAQVSRGRKAAMPLHDLLAFYVLCDPSLVETQACRVHVETRSILTKGFTFCDFTDLEMDHRYAFKVDVPRALRKYQSLIELFKNFSF